MEIQFKFNRTILNILLISILIFTTFSEAFAVNLKFFCLGHLSLFLKQIPLPFHSHLPKVPNSKHIFFLGHKHSIEDVCVKDDRKQTSPQNKANHLNSRSFRRRQGIITRGQRKALRNLWPKYGIDLKYGERVSPLTFFGSRYQDSSIAVLEIGFGTGSTLVSLAKENPDQLYVAVEVHKPGVGATLKKLAESGLQNVKLIMADAVKAISDHFNTEKIFDEVLILFPDPFPEDRQSSRRIVREPFIRELERIMKDGAALYIATDVEVYAEHVKTVMGNMRNWKSCGTEENGTIKRPAWRPLTKYEQCGIGLGHSIYDFKYIYKKIETNALLTEQGL